MNTTIQIKVKKALILPSITLLHTFCTIFLHKVQILYLNNKKLTFHLILHNRLVLKQDSQLSHMPETAFPSH